ncbi:MAG: WD40/YVTN/BNR-like repeat-containing protein, partial [Candidatus Acidiferrales bacterium]
MIRNRQSWKSNASQALRSPLRSALAALVFILLGAATLPSPLQAQTATPEEAARIDPSLFSSMRWRSIGPYRAGRVSAVAGISGDPSTYYMGTPGGGVWKTTDGGITWKPIFDKERVASIGAVAVAPSDPNIIYVGTGEQTDGNGMYKSTDAGATWTHVGLENTHYISSIIVDPRNPEIVLVGVLGHPILSVSAPSPEKGVFKTTDGGKTWTKTLYQDEMAGVSDLAVDPENPRVLYAALWHPADWRSGEGLGDKPDAWMYKSTDEGSTWKILPSTGMPAEPWG